MKFKSLFLVAGCAFALVACQQKSQGRVPDWPWGGDDEEEDERTEWTLVADDVFGKLPDYVKLYQSPSRLLGDKAIAYVAEVDLTKTSFEVWGLDAPDLNGSDEPLQTPSEAYENLGHPCIVINGGYFYTDSGRSYSSSLEVSNGKLLSPNLNYTSRDWVTMYYPTRAAFIEHEDGTYEVAWTYWKDADHHYLYDEPAKNSWDEKPLKTPDATFPVEARAFEAKNAIGGSPVLIKGGEILNTYQEELIDIEAYLDAPRTAIGITKDRKTLVLFVCEGRNMTPDVPGYTTGEVAKILKEYGCEDAMNLDGGGSTLMLVNGNETLLPSDGHQRAVGSVVYIR